MNPVDAVWARMKSSAARFAEQGVSVSRSHAQMLVKQFIREAGVDPWPPPGVIEFFVNELLQMVDSRASCA